MKHGPISVLSQNWETQVQEDKPINWTIRGMYEWSCESLSGCYSGYTFDNARFGVVL